MLVLTWSWSLQVFPVHVPPDVGLVSSLVHEPAHKTVSVDAVEQDAGAVLWRSGAAQLHQRQAAERHLAAGAPAGLVGAHLHGGQQRRSLLRRVLHVQHEVLPPGAERAAAVRVLCRSGRQHNGEKEEKEGEEVGGGGGGHTQLLSVSLNGAGRKQFAASWRVAPLRSESLQKLFRSVVDETVKSFNTHTERELGIKCVCELCVCLSLLRSGPQVCLTCTQTGSDSGHASDWRHGDVT